MLLKIIGTRLFLESLPSKDFKKTYHLTREILIVIYISLQENRNKKMSGIQIIAFIAWRRPMKY